jgi:hypothetical protein
MKTPEEYSQEIDIATREMNYAKNSESKANWSIKIAKLKLERECALIRKKIELLNK